MLGSYGSRGLDESHMEYAYMEYASRVYLENSFLEGDLFFLVFLEKFGDGLLLVMGYYSGSI